MLAYKKGICRAYIERYYYDIKSGLCRRFVYGGCGGNKNRFLTEDDCMNCCGKENLFIKCLYACLRVGRKGRF